MEQELIDKYKSEHGSYIREVYESLNDVWDQIEKTKAGDGWQVYEQNSSLYPGERNGFRQFDSMLAWLDACTHQNTPLYLETMERAEDIVKQADIKLDWQTWENKRTRTWSNTGVSISRSRLYNGHATSAFRRLRRQLKSTNTGVITILIPFDADVHTPSERLQNASLAAYTLTDALERQNRSCEIWGIATHRRAYKVKRRWYPWLCAIRLKSAGYRASLSTISPILFSDFFRRTIFRLYEKNNMWELAEDYGKPVSGKPEYWHTIQDLIDDYRLDADGLITAPEPNSWYTRNVEGVIDWVTTTLNSLNG